MKRFQIYTPCITIFMLAVLMSGCGSGGNPVTPPQPAPSVMSVNPANAATNVAIGQIITVNFSEAMSFSSINNTTFTLTGAGGTSVAGTAASSGSTATFTPSAGFSPNTTYTITITTGAQNLQGTGLASDFVSSFTTAASPTVTATIPLAGAILVPTGVTLTATFGVPMDPTTINSTTFTLTGFGGVLVTGTVTYPGTSASFAPAAELAPNTTYTATITTGAKSTTGFAMASSYRWSFETGASSGANPPTVIFTDPANAATGVPINQKIAATFSEAMDPATITTATFQVTSPGGTSMTGTVVYVALGATATFTPTVNLSPLTTYTATITTGASSLTGHALAANFVWSFTTGVTVDTTKPTVIATIPAANATAVPIDQIMAVFFSEGMDPATINATTFTVTGPGGTPVDGIVAYAAVGTTATLIPTNYLPSFTTFTLSITTGATDLAGNPLAANFSITFTTGDSHGDAYPVPTVIFTSPANNASGVGLNQNINATFSDLMDPLTFTTADFFVTGPGGAPVAGTVAFHLSYKLVTFTPLSNLAPLTTYTATITSAVEDIEEVPMAQNYVWSFTTGTAPNPQSAIALGSATTFAVLAGPSVSNVGASLVNGDLGVSPGNTVTGFPPGTVNGTIYAGVPAAAQAQVDLATAYTDAAAQSAGSVSVAGNIGGITLAAGLYNSSSELEISSGDLTLDGQGDANAVFIFQAASSLVVAVGHQVILVNGAKASNVYWQVGTFVTLATSCVMKGNILANGAIDIQNGANLEGRALTENGAITIDTSVITLPLP